MKNKIYASAFIMSIGTFLSRILGLLREAFLASYFDRYTTDIFYVAYRIPNLFRRLLGEGSFSISFIPVFVEIINKEKKQELSKEESKRLVNHVFSLLLVILMTLILIGNIYIEELIHLLVGGDVYTSIEGKLQDTVIIARIMFSFIFLISLFAYFMAILNGLKHFAFPALAPCFLNISIIIACLLPNYFDLKAKMLAWAVIFGGFFQAAFLIPKLWKSGYFPHFSFKLNPNVKKVITNFIPGSIGIGIIQITAVINTYFASYLSQGSHSWLYWADRIIELPLSLIAVSMGTALLPSLSQYAANKEFKIMGEVNNHYLRSALFLAIPACVGIFCLAQPIIEVIFMRGNFDLFDAQKTSGILKIYAFILITSTGIRILSSSFYAIKKVWFPATCSLIGLLAHVFLAMYLIEIYGLEGLALSSLFSAIVNLSILILFYNYFVGSLQILKLLISILKFSLAAFVMFFVTKIYYYFISLKMDLSFFDKSLFLFITITLCVFVYVGINFLLKSEETKIIKKIFKKFSF